MKIKIDSITKKISYLSDILKDKENYTFVNVLCSTSILLSLVILAIGFSSAVLSFYIGDFNLRFLLLSLSSLFILQIIYSAVTFKNYKKLISFTIVTAVIILIAVYISSLPPVYGLRDFDIDASILKFFISSIIMVIVGVLGVSFSLKPVYRFTSKASQASAYFIIIFSIFLTLYALINIIGNVMVSGFPAISWDFLTQDFMDHGQQGGVSSALVGTLLLMAGVAVIAIPLGVGSAIYLCEYAKPGKIVRVIRIAVDILQGIPSIVHGLFGFAVFAPIFGFSLLSGILTLSFMTLPIIIRSSEEAIRSIPQALREGSYAVGATKWQTIRRVVLPPSIPGIITGGVLGIGRASGETAPILFFAYTMGAGIPGSIFDSFQALPFHLYELTRKIGAYDVEQNAWGTAFLLLSIILIINAVSIVLREKYRVEF